MNEPIERDALCRANILTLLLADQQRMLFMKTAKNSAAWQRIKPLFGVPPYHFLRTEDAGMLRAGGFGLNGHLSCCADGRLADRCDTHQ